MNSDVLLWIGQILLAFAFLTSGYGHAFSFAAWSARPGTSLGLDEALGGVDEAVTPDRMRLWIEDPRHPFLPSTRPTVGLIIPRPSVGRRVSR
jgi:hypothetical protein